jgi:hypothetical protein
MLKCLKVTKELEENKFVFPEDQRLMLANKFDNADQFLLNAISSNPAVASWPSRYIHVVCISHVSEDAMLSIPV